MRSCLSPRPCRSKPRVPTNSTGQVAIRSFLVPTIDAKARPPPVPKPEQQVIEHRALAEIRPDAQERRDRHERQRHHEPGCECCVPQVTGSQPCEDEERCDEI